MDSGIRQDPSLHTITIGRELRCESHPQSTTSTNPVCSRSANRTGPTTNDRRFTFPREFFGKTRIRTAQSQIACSSTPDSPGVEETLVPLSAEWKSARRKQIFYTPFARIPHRLANLCPVNV